VGKAAELSKRELIASVPTFLTKVSKYRPRVVCFVGIGIWDIVEAAFRKMVVVQGASPRKKQKAEKPPKRVLCLQPYKMLHPTGANPWTTPQTLPLMIPIRRGDVLFRCS
jgi:thymine-DNA glycosylase